MTRRATECALIVFAKAPEAGQVKTRLMPALGAEGAAALQSRLTRHALATALAAGIGPVELCCAPSLEHPFFRRCAAEFGVRLSQQCAGDLGARMAQALQRRVASGPVVLIGGDCPALTADVLRSARDALERHDAVLAPAEDGGYVLIGLNRFDPSLFEGIAWGASTVADETRARLARLGWSWAELAELWDVDRPEDLERLVRAGLIDRAGLLRPSDASLAAR